MEVDSCWLKQKDEDFGSFREKGRVSVDFSVMSAMRWICSLLQFLEKAPV